MNYSSDPALLLRGARNMTDVLTPKALPPGFRDIVLAEAVPL